MIKALLDHTSYLFLPQFLNSDSMEPTPPAAYTPTSVRNVSASHESPDPRPIPTNNATSPSAPKPAGPSSAAKYSGWQPPSQAGNLQ